MNKIDYKSIKGLINVDKLEKAIEINNDPYGGACVQVALNVMKHLDTFNGEFNIGYKPDKSTPHCIICDCDNVGGITGFQASAVRNMVLSFHELGVKFYLVDVINNFCYMVLVMMN